MKKISLAIILTFILLITCACSPKTDGSIAAAPSSSLPESSDAPVSSKEPVSSEITICSEVPVSSNPPSQNEFTIHARNLSAGYSANISVKSVSLKGATGKTAFDFSYNLFKNAYSEKSNTLISPASVMYALAMAANGAEGNTLKQIENAFGTDRDTLNLYLKSYLSALPKEDSTLKLSQSIWINQYDSVKENFLQTNANYYNAEIYSAPMNQSTVKDINNWVSDKTDGEIQRAINDLSHNDLLVLINATLFEGKWETDYRNSSIRSGTFDNQNHSKADVTYLYSTEDIYLSGEGFTGFVKPYAGERFAFAALLPDADTPLSSLISSLNGSEFSAIIKGAKRQEVSVCIPEFEIKFDTSLNVILKKMGITDAFGSNADFSSMSDGSIYISEADHKTSIKLNRYGTKAAATTVIKAARGAYTEPKTVYLNRPFLYLIYDTQADLPAFIGTVTNLS